MLETVCQIGIQLLTCIQMFHQTGHVHNDIKPDNIIVGDAKNSDKSLNQIRLIDFGLSTSFIDEKGNHIQQQKSLFSGNAAFCSMHALL